MTREDVEDLVGRMRTFHRKAEGQPTEAWVDFGNGWQVPAERVRRAVLGAYDQWVRDPDTTTPHRWYYMPGDPF